VSAGEIAKDNGGLPPDFLSILVASANLMRLSLLKAAHVVAGECQVAGNPEYAGANEGHPSIS
jgi:hypothetical protein